MTDTLLRAVGAAILGVVLGWTGSALTLSGRVTAIEAGQVRVENKLDRLLERGASPPPPQQVTAAAGTKP